MVCQQNSCTENQTKERFVSISR